MMKPLYTIIFLLLPFSAAAEDICPAYIPGEYEPLDLIINESDFTYEKALSALKTLGHVTEKPDKETTGSEKYISTANAEIIIKGYILRSECKANNTQKACDEFCNYLSKRRYWFD